MGEDVVSISKEYYSAVKNKDIMPLVTTWMKSEGIMLSEISQRKILQISFVVKSLKKKKKKRQNFYKQKVEWQLPAARV